MHPTALRIMKKEEYRKLFLEYLDDEVRYGKFVAQINSRQKNRLAYWQEKEIENFSEKHSLQVLSYDELLDIFSICEVHGDELQDGVVRVFNGHIDYSPAYGESASKLFPNSYLDEINGPRELYGKDAPVRFCPSCRKARNEWIDKMHNKAIQH